MYILFVNRTKRWLSEDKETPLHINFWHTYFINLYSKPISYLFVSGQENKQLHQVNAFLTIPISLMKDLVNTLNMTLHYSLFVQFESHKFLSPWLRLTYLQIIDR